MNCAQQLCLKNSDFKKSYEVRERLASLVNLHSFILPNEGKQHHKANLQAGTVSTRTNFGVW